MSNSEIADKIKEAFEEGYYGYSTPCNAYNTVESAWDESEAKKIYDTLKASA